MREIKFRAWNTIVKRFQFFDLIEIEQQKGEIQWPLLKIDQYIGIKDKDGKEIYEGDEVKIRQERYNTIEYFCGIIGFQDGTFCIEMTKQPERAKKQGYIERVRLWNSGEYDHYSLETIESFEIEITGNIHENKVES